MIQHIILHDCVSDFRDDVESYWGRKARRIERVLGHMPADLQRLQLTLWHRRFEHQARGVLKLPFGTVVAEGASPDYRAAMDLVADRMVEEVRKHISLLRHNRPRRRSGRRAIESSRTLSPPIAAEWSPST